MQQPTFNASKREFLRMVSGGTLLAGATGVAVGKRGGQPTFRCDFDTHVVRKKSLGPQSAHLWFAGEATGTHVGRARARHEHTTTGIGTGERHFEGTYELTAANGDGLKGTYQGSTIEGDEVLVATGTWEHTGGTGRFEDVSGSGTLSSREERPADGNLEIHFEGTISF